MITFFTTAKPFRGHDGMIQRNALQSWKLLYPDVEVILFGDEEGAAEVCAELGLRHQPHVERHESGTKYLNYMFDRAQQIARYDYLCYSNCDIVLLPDFWHVFEIATAWKKKFLLIAHRWDTDVTDRLDFGDAEWARNLRQLALSSGRRQDPTFKDFFLFPRGLYDSIPSLVVGRSAWDSWLVWKALDSRIPVIDASPLLIPVHQNHDYGYHPQGKQGTSEDALAMRNFELCGNGQHLAHILDSTHMLTKYGRIKSTPFRKLLSTPLAQRITNLILVKSAPLRNLLGLRRQTLDRLLHRRTDSTS